MIGPPSRPFLYKSLYKAALYGNRKKKALRNSLLRKALFRAGDGIRTRDFQLGKLALYH